MCEDCEDANQWGEKGCTICQSPPSYTLLHSMVVPSCDQSDEALEEVYDWILNGSPESMSPEGMSLAS